MAEANITIDVLNMDKTMEMRDALESLIAAASDYVKPRRATDARQVLLERLDAARAALAQSEAQPVAWRDHVEQRLLTWRQRTMNRSGDHLALDDFMDKESLDDLIDFVCDEWAGPAASPQQPQPVLDASWEQSTLRPQQAYVSVQSYVSMSDLNFVHSVLGDVLVAIADWEDRTLAEAVEEARTRIEPLVVARMRGEGK